MNAREYFQTQIELLKVARALKKIDLAGFLDRANLADTAGPILNPTLYRLACSRLSMIIELATAAKQFQEAIARIEARAGERL